MSKFLTLFLLFICSLAWGQKQLAYQQPPREILDLLNAPQTPHTSLSPTGDWLLQMKGPAFLSIETLAQEELRLAGLRLNPHINARSRLKYYDTLRLTDLKSGKDYEISGLPAHAQIQHITWAPNGAYVAFTHTLVQGMEVWVLDVQKKKAWKLTEAKVNGTLMEDPLQWTENNEWLLFPAVLQGRGELPKRPVVPLGPEVQESNGERTLLRTYQDLLQDVYQEQQFAYLVTSQLTKVNLKGEQYAFGMPAMYKAVEASPDQSYWLVEVLQTPFSHLVPYHRFPFKVEVWTADGVLWRELFTIPLAENIPQGFGAVRTGPRHVGWRSDKPASLYWVEAMDGGDPSRKAAVRDRLFLYEPPFDGDGQPSIHFSYRFGSIAWCSEHRALATEWWWDTRMEQVSVFDPAEEEGEKTVLLTYNWQDAYHYPGEFMTVKNSWGREVLAYDEQDQLFFLRSRGASPDGDQPFVDAYSINDGSTKRLWRSRDPYYEYPLAFLDVQKQVVLTRQETKEDVPNYFTRNLKSDVVKQMTNFLNPYPQLDQVKQELVKYKRADGIQLSGKLYLPPGFSLGDAYLPVLMWAYPNEYKSVQSASQVQGSPNRFVRISWRSPLFWVLRGYAVFDDPAMPVIGSGDAEPNDTFVEQLVANAEAAVKALDSMGIIDKKRVAIGGHSYGAFMVANLLAHSDLFAAGIARSGAYNRSLTPFGFQAEQRTFWEAPETYMHMSPFSYANKVNEPLLLIHGEADNNAGTYPLQSERFYMAIKGNGGKARLVVLPGESHGYQAKESVCHMLWEMDRWLEQNVKNKK